MIEHLHGREKQRYDSLTDKQKEKARDYFDAMSDSTLDDAYKAVNSVRIVEAKARRGEL